MTELKIGGQAFDARIRETDEIIYLYYDIEFENQFKNHQGLVNALENHVRAKTDDEEKEIVFRADPSY